MTELKQLIDELYTDNLNRKVFWHYTMPVNYNTNKLYQGLNFLILGLQEKSLIDPRWGIVQDFKKKGQELYDNADVVNILYWEDDLIKETVYPVPVFSITDSSDYSSYYQTATDVNLLEFLENYRIPYIESDLSSYSPLNDTLYINTEPKGDNIVAFQKSLPAISRWCVNNYDLKNENILKGLEKQDLPKFLLILDDLVMFKLSHSLGIRINKCLEKDDVCESIQYFYEKNKKTPLLAVFVVADKVVNNFMIRKEKANEIMLDFLTSETSNELLRTMSRQELLSIQENMSQLIANKAEENGTAYLHFSSYFSDGYIDLYITSYDERAEEPIKGTLMINGKEPHLATYTPWDLCAQFEIDTLFKKDQLSTFIPSN